MRKLFLMTENGLVDITVEREQRAATAQSHYVITDTMEALWHPATGQMLDSKSEFRKMTKMSGCEEVGNERRKVETPELPGRKDDIIRAIDEWSGGK